MARFEDQLFRIRRGAGVVPQQGRADHVSGLIKAHHAVLLTAHGDGVDVVQAARLRDRFLQGGPPMIRVDLGALRVGSPALTHQGAGV
jgi:hypothetical protein